jgi:hypothetical protein
MPILCFTEPPVVGPNINYMNDMNGQLDCNYCNGPFGDGPDGHIGLNYGNQSTPWVDPEDSNGLDITPSKTLWTLAKIYNLDQKFQPQYQSASIRSQIMVRY